MLNAFPEIICAYSEGLHNMSFAYGEAHEVITNRKSFLGSLGIDYRNVACCQQAHTDTIRYVTKEDRGKGALDYESGLEATDALVTDQAEVPLAVLTADCLPVFLYDPITRSIGMVHAGWRGTLVSITGKTVTFMQEKFGTQPGNLKVGLGPRIKQCCFQVGDEFKDHFPGFIREHAGKRYVDFTQANIQQLKQAGVHPDNIEDSNICTGCESNRFFSVRASGPECGRFMSVIQLKGG